MVVDQVDYDILVNKLSDAFDSIKKLEKYLKSKDDEIVNLRKELSKAKYSEDTIWKVRYDKLKEVLRKEKEDD